MDGTPKSNGFRAGGKEEIFGVKPAIDDRHQKTLRRDPFFRFPFLAFFSVLFLFCDLIGSLVRGKRKGYLYLELRLSHETEDVKEGMGYFSITSFT